MPRKPGPKTELPHDTELQRVTLMLDPLTRRKLRVLGKDNESLGARIAARVAFDRYQKSEEAGVTPRTTTATPASQPPPPAAPAEPLAPRGGTPA